MSVRLLTATMAALAVGLAGCGTPPPRVAEPLPQAAPRTEMPAASSQSAGSTSTTPALAEGATIPVATLIDLARQTSPTRALFEAHRAAAAAAVEQAGAWANPEIELGIGKSRPREADESGSRTAVTTGGVRLSQRFELPGKRSSRIAAAEFERTLAERSAAVDALDLELEVRAAAVAVALADQQAALAAQTEILATQVHTAVQSRNRAGESDQGDLARATAELATAGLARDGAERDAEAARAALRNWCGPTLPATFHIADGLLETPEALALTAVQAQARAAHPRLAALDTRSSAAAAAIRREERAWYPDLTVGVTGSRESDTNDVGVSLGMEVPLWNRNSGGIAQAQAELARIAAERRQELAALERQVLASWSAYERERRQIVGLTENLLPASREAVRVKLAAYQAGDAALFDLIDARHGLMEAEQSLLTAKSRAAQARLDLARAVGTAAAPIPAADLTPPTGNAPAATTTPLPTGTRP